MTIGFPNHSRTYDASRQAVRFWGYDQTLEVMFRIDRFALARIDADSGQDEGSLLSAFDRHRDRIVRVAGDVYARRPSAMCQLVEGDF